jgi:hypothetical protein
MKRFISILLCILFGVLGLGGVLFSQNTLAQNQPPVKVNSVSITVGSAVKEIKLRDTVQQGTEMTVKMNLEQIGPLAQNEKIMVSTQMQNLSQWKFIADGGTEKYLIGRQIELPVPFKNASLEVTGKAPIEISEEIVNGLVVQLAPPVDFYVYKVYRIFNNNDVEQYKISGGELLIISKHPVAVRIDIKTGIKSSAMTQALNEGDINRADVLYEAENDLGRYVTGFVFAIVPVAGLTILVLWLIAKKKSPLP